MSISSPMSIKGKGKMPESAFDPPRNAAFQQPQSGAKKLVIKNLRATRRKEEIEQYYRETRNGLRVSLEAMLFGEQPGQPLERIYRGVEDVCRHGEADVLYAILKESCEKYLNEVLREDVRTANVKVNADILAAVCEYWKKWNKNMLLVRSTFAYLDQSYIIHNKSLLPINNLAIILFKKAIFGSSRHDPSTYGGGVTLVAGMCDMVDYDRKEDPRFDPVLLKESVTMLHILGTYDKNFEQPFLDRAMDYFTEFQASWSGHGPKRYIEEVDRLLKSEGSRCLEYNFDSTTRKQLLDVGHRQLIKEYSETLLDYGHIEKLLADNEIRTMSALYELLKRSQMQKELVGPWRRYIVKAGASVIADTTRVEALILHLLSLKRKLEFMVREAFGLSEFMVDSMQHAFKDFMNDRRLIGSWGGGASRIGELIAKYIDMLLRGGLKSLPQDLLSDLAAQRTAENSGETSTQVEDGELHRQLNNALALFRCIEAKDAFEAFYKRDLARRLLLGRSASHEAEQAMITKLREECGPNFTHNLDQMFRDQEVAKDEMDGYRQLLEVNPNIKAPFDLDVKVLSSSAWPSYPDVNITFPEEIAVQIEQFDRFYKNRHTGRKLNWKHSLATCIIKARFRRRQHELCVSGQQAVVLLLFNDTPDGGRLAYEQISEGTGLVGEELNRTLQSLACAKQRVLAKHPKGRDIAMTDEFSFNAAFSELKYRIKINQIQLRETKEENRETHERIVQDRRFETQAAIVRIMKSRKRMTHAELVPEVIKLTKNRGSVDAADVKKEIESLLDKDYMEREGNVYEYLV